MNATEFAAWVGAATGLAGLGWNVYLKISSGPSLDVTAIADIKLMPPEGGNPSYISVTVQNVGTATTTLTNLSLQLYSSWWKRKRRNAEKNYVVVNYRGPDFPHRLEVGHEWRGLFPQDNALVAMITTDRLYCGVWHSFSNRPVERRVIRPAKR
jgi:hypothetical protein